MTLLGGLLVRWEYQQVDSMANSHPELQTFQVGCQFPARILVALKEQHLAPVCPQNHPSHALRTLEASAQAFLPIFLDNSRLGPNHELATFCRLQVRQQLLPQALVTRADDVVVVVREHPGEEASLLCPVEVSGLKGQTDSSPLGPSREVELNKPEIGAQDVVEAEVPMAAALLQGQLQPFQQHSQPLCAPVPMLRHQMT